MRIKILSCHHQVPAEPLMTSLFATLVSGEPSDPKGRFLGDLDGPNIATQNEHSELRLHYHVWKHLLPHYDYVGFEHYRRLFFLDPIPGAEMSARYPFFHGLRRHFQRDQGAGFAELTPAEFSAYQSMRRNFDAQSVQRLKAWISDHDVITLRPFAPAPLDEQWHTTGVAPYWDQLIAAMRAHSYFQDRPAEFDVSLNQPSYCNTYIMRADLFDEYMRFWLEAMTLLAASLTVTPRLLGHFAERVFNFFLMQKRVENPLLRVSRLPFLLLNPS